MLISLYEGKISVKIESKEKVIGWVSFCFRKSDHSQHIYMSSHFKTFGAVYIFLSNYLLINMSFNIGLMHSDMFWTFSAYYCLNYSSYSLNDQDHYVSYFLSVVDWLFQLKGLNRMCLVSIMSVNWTISLTWYSL